MASSVIRRAFFSRPVPGASPVIVIPAVLNRPEADIDSILAPWLVKGARVAASSESVPAGHLILTSPQVGINRPVGTVVAYEVSTGPA